MNQPNSDRDAELAVLAACLASKVARQQARAALSGKDFHEPAHEVIWDAMARLDKHGKTVDPVTVNATIAAYPAAVPVMLELVTAFAQPDQIEQYAAIVRGWAMKRRLVILAAQVQQRAMNPDLNAAGYAATVANQFATIRDSGATEDIETLTLDEVVALPDEDYDWVIPGLLERGDRLILTGAEGLGKSSMLRQIAVYAAAGIHPFKPGKRINPVRAFIYDNENSLKQIKRKVEPLRVDANRRGRAPGPHVLIECPGRIDLVRDKDLARVHHILDAVLPDIMVIGPIYKMAPRALQTDDEAAPLLAALDTIRERGIALLIEAHAGHAAGANGREWRPRGSSALMGWPEFGLGLKDEGGGIADVIPWRGSRDERDWPSRVRRDPSTMSWRDLDEREVFVA